MTERFIDVEGVINFRDYGGYAGRDGRRLPWRRLFRSAGHHAATDRALPVLQGLNLAAVVDLRRRAEREREPSRRPPGFAARLVECQSTTDTGEDGWWGFMSQADPGPGLLRGYLVDYYRKLPFEDRYVALARDYFSVLAEVDGPVLIHCSAGRDRTGVLAALTHAMLGVSRDDLFADYLLSNAAPGMEARVVLLRERLSKRAGSELSMASVKAAFMADAAYLDGALKAIDEQGGLDGYLERVLGVTPAMRARIEARLLV